MTDLHAAVQAARTDLADTIPLLRHALRACWGLVYADSARERTRGPRPARCWTCRHYADGHAPECERCDCTEATDPPERVQRCGACDHPADAHTTQGCESCRCAGWEDTPSTVGWGLWTAPGPAEVAWTRACKEIQRASDSLYEVDAVCSRWASSCLHKPGERTVPIHLDLVLHGVGLLGVALEDVGDDLAPPEASAVLEAADHARAALKHLVDAQDPIRDDEWDELNRPRCVEEGCRVQAHAKGRCREHYDTMRRSA